MSDIEEKLRSLGLELPEPLKPSPLADHLEVKREGNLLFIAGTGPILKGKPAITGRLVRDMKHEDGYAAAQLAALNVLSLIREEAGSLDEIEEFVKVTGYVASDEDFYDQHMILNGASHLFNGLFGEKGSHVVTAVGVSVLPFHVPVVLDVIVRLKDRKEAGT